MAWWISGALACGLLTGCASTMRGLAKGPQRVDENVSGLHARFKHAARRILKREA